MNRIFISPNYGYESVCPGDILAFSRTTEHDEETDSDVDYAEAETVLQYDFNEEDDDDETEEIIIEFDFADDVASTLSNDEDEDKEAIHEDKRIASVFMRVVSVTPPVKKLFRKERGHIIVELPDKKQVELYDFANHNNGVHMLSTEMEDYIRSVRGLCTRLSVEARIENQKAVYPDFFGLELFNVNEDPSSFKKALEEELEQRRIVATQKNQTEQASKQIEKVEKFFAEILEQA